MNKLYFTSVDTSIVQDWDGISDEPFNIASFEFDGIIPTTTKRYLLTPDKATYIALYPEIPDDELNVYIAEMALSGMIKAVNPVKLKLGFTKEERVSIYASTDPYVIDFLKILDDPRLVSVNLYSKDTRDAFDLLVSLGLLTEVRKVEILDIF